MQPQISAVKIVALYLNDSDIENFTSRALSLAHMKNGWMEAMGIDHNKLPTFYQSLDQ